MMNKPPFVIAILWLLVSVMVFAPSAMDARREDYVGRGLQLLEKGDEALKGRDYEKATAYYKAACDYLPNAPETKTSYDRAVDSFCKASCGLAEQRVAEGRSAEARNALMIVLDERYNPSCKEAIKLLAELEDSDWTTRTIGPELRAKIEKIKQLMKEAEGYYAAARYELASERCAQVLSIDPYFRAARVLQENCEFAQGARKNQNGREEASPVVAPPSAAGATDGLTTGMLDRESGDRALKVRDYEKAVACYQRACDLISKTEATKVAYGAALDSFCKASCLLAEQRVAEGRYADAQAVLYTVVATRTRSSFSPGWRIRIGTTSSWGRNSAPMRKRSSSS